MFVTSDIFATYLHNDVKTKLTAEGATYINNADVDQRRSAFVFVAKRGQPELTVQNGTAPYKGPAIITATTGMGFIYQIQILSV